MKSFCFLVPVFVLTAAGCKAGPELNVVRPQEPSAVYEAESLAEAVTGTYRFAWLAGADLKPVLEGKLALRKDGSYVFAADEAGSVMFRRASKRFVFMDRPRGEYSITFDPLHKGYDSDRPVDSVRNGAFVARIDMDPSNAASPLEKTQAVFYLMTNEKEKAIEFHSLVSEIQNWHVIKSL